MSRPSPTLTSKRFFLSFHRSISTTSSPLTHHHPPPPATTKHLHPSSFRHLTTAPSTRYASSTSTSTSETPLTTPSKPLPSSHYDLFPSTLPTGPPPRGPFVINTRQLRTEYLRLQSRSHPDLHRGPDKARAEGTSALINEAYRTLTDPLLRAQHLLSLRGVDVAEDESAKVEDAELLMEVLEVREAIEAAGQESDLDGLKRDNDERIADSEGVLDDAFKGDVICLAKSEAVKLRYWMNIKESLDAWEKGKPVVLVH